MEQLDYIIILLYFLGLIAVSVVMSWKIKNSEDMFIAGRNSSWWLSGVSSYNDYLLRQVPLSFGEALLINRDLLR